MLGKRFGRQHGSGFGNVKITTPLVYTLMFGLLLASSALSMADDKNKDEGKGAAELAAEEIEEVEITVDDTTTGSHRVLIFKGGDGDGDKNGNLIELHIDSDGQVPEAMNAQWIQAIINGEQNSATKLSSYMIGIGCEPVSDLLRHHLKLESKVGLAIQSVVDESAAQKAGLQEHDIIVQLGDTPIKSVADVGRALDDADGAETEVHFVRTGKKQKARITAVKRKQLSNSFTFKSDIDDLDVDLEAIKDGIFSVSPGLRLQAGSQINEALQQAMTARGQVRTAERSVRKQVEQLNKKMKELQKQDQSQLRRLEEVQKQLGTQLSDLKTLLEQKLSEK